MSHGMKGSSGGGPADGDAQAAQSRDEMLGDAPTIPLVKIGFAQIRVRRIDGAGHNPRWEHPADFNRQVFAFCRRTRRTIPRGADGGAGRSSPSVLQPLAAPHTRLGAGTIRPLRRRCTGLNHWRRSRHAFL